MQTVQWLRRGKWKPIHTDFRVRGELLTTTESIIRWWKVYFKDHLLSMNTYSKGEVEPEDFGLGSLITGVEVTEAVKQLCSGSAPGWIRFVMSSSRLWML